jgi:Flp pilus assembly protein TadD
MAQFSRPSRYMVFALLTTTAAAALLGACNQTDRLFSRNSAPTEVKMSAAEAAGATSKWASAYAKNPQDPKVALGYAQTLKAIGSKERSLEILKTAYQANPGNGEVAAELGRLALEVGRIDIAKQALNAAEVQGMQDWKTLSAQGTLHAKQGEHGEAQKYYLAALKEKPDAVSVINNLALSYALDGKAKESEELLRKAVASGHENKRVRQNLALVLGLQGKFDDARQVASVDMTDMQAKSSMSYLRNMLSSPTKVASANPKASGGDQGSADDWSPFASNMPVREQAPVKTASAVEPMPSPAKVEVVKPVEKVEAPAVKTASAANPNPAPAQTELAKTQIVNPVKTAVAVKTVQTPEAKSNTAPGVPTQITPTSQLRHNFD